MILDLILMTTPIVIIGVVAVKMVLPMRNLDFSQPPAPPPPVWMSLLGLVATMALVVRWIITGRPGDEIAGAIFAMLSMLYCCRMAARAVAQYEETQEVWARWRELDNGA